MSKRDKGKGVQKPDDYTTKKKQVKEEQKEKIIPAPIKNTFDCLSSFPPLP